MSGSESEDHSGVANPKPHKLFITGLDGKAQLADLEAELRRIFSKYGPLVTVVPKKSYNHEYCYAFIDFGEDVDATLAMKRENNSTVGGAKITVSIQDNLRRKKTTSDGCYKCGKMGHYARDCKNGNEKSVEKSASRDKSDRKKKKKRRHSSDDSRSRSRSARKKQKKKRSKSRGKKHSKSSKKSKKQRRRSRSRSN